jgi:hypothetical protein
MAIEDTLKYHINIVTNNFDKAHNAILNITKDMAMLSNMSSQGAANVKNLENAYSRSFKNIENRFVALRDVAEAMYKYQTQTWLTMGKLPELFIKSLTEVQNKLSVFGRKEAVDDIKSIANAFKEFPTVGQNVIDSLAKKDWKSVQRAIQILPEDIGIKLNEIVTKTRMLEGPQDKATRLMVAFGKVSSEVGSTITEMYQGIVYLFKDEITAALDFVRKKFAEISSWVSGNKTKIKEVIDSVIKGIKEIGIFLGGVGQTIFGWGKYFLSVFEKAPSGIKETLKWLTAIHITLKLISGHGLLGLTGSALGMAGRGVMNTPGALSTIFGAGRGGGLFAATGTLSRLGGIGAAGAGAFAGSALGDWGARKGAEALGGGTGAQNVAGVAGSALGGAAAGALIGSIIPGVGTALGGIIGAGVGAARGLYNVREAANENAKAQKEAAEAIRSSKFQEDITKFTTGSKFDFVKADLGKEFSGKFMDEFKRAKTEAGDRNIDVTGVAGKRMMEQGEVANRLIEKARESGVVGTDEEIRKNLGPAIAEVIESAINQAKAKEGDTDKDPFGVGTALKNIQLYSQFSDNAVASASAIVAEMEKGGVTSERINELAQKRTQAMEKLNFLEENISKARLLMANQLEDEKKKINENTNLKEEEKKLQILELENQYSTRIRESDQAHAEILNKKAQLREASLKRFELEVEMTEKRIELARIDTQMAESVYGTAGMAYEAIKKTVEELENKRQIQKQELQEAIKLRQEAEATGGDARAALVKELDLRAALKRTTLEQLQLLKQVRDGYLSAVQAQQIGLGTFAKLIVTEEQNVGIADIANMKRRNFLTGMANPAGEIQSRRFGAYGGIVSGGTIQTPDSINRDLNTMQGRMNAFQKSMIYGSINADAVGAMTAGVVPGLLSAEKQAELVSRSSGKSGNVGAINQMGTQQRPSPTRSVPAPGSANAGSDVKVASDNLVMAAQQLRSAIVNSIPEPATSSGVGAISTQFMNS